MSIYRPDPKTLYAALLIDGWWVMDSFGPLDGPYKTAFDVNAVIAAEAEADLSRRYSYSSAGSSTDE